MTEWLDRANAAYQARLERIEAETTAKTQRLVIKVSEFLGERIEHSGKPASERVNVDSGKHVITFVFGDAEEKSVAALYECALCGGEFPVVMTDMEDLGRFLSEGSPEHDLVCRNQKKD